MIKHVTGNIFDSQAQAFVNPVNTKGAMGKGLALEFKRRYQDNLKAYQAYCRKGLLRPGDVFTFKNPLGAPDWIFNIAVKDHWSNPSQIEWVQKGLDKLAELISLHEIQSVAVPALGAGLGGLEWEKVKQQIDARLSGTDACILVYAPHEMPKHGSGSELARFLARRPRLRA